MTANATSSYDRIYSLVRNAFTHDPLIWTQTYDYIRQHPNDLFFIASDRNWSIAHQIIYHGGLKVFKDILQLYNEQNPINIYSTTKDSKPKTILDVAHDRKSSFNEQYQYIEHLFAQDKFIRACQVFDWTLVDEMLAKNRRLLNEKPPYYSNYLIHYLALYGDARIFSSFNSPDNPLQLGLKNADGKTALDLAHEHRKQDIIDEIQQLLIRTPSKSVIVSVEPDDRDDDERRTPSPPPPPPRPRVSSNVNRSAPEPAGLSSEILKRVICRLTNEVFVEPVRASDGHTYERTAIQNHLQNSRYSPATGEAMDDTLSPDIPMRNFIRDLRRRNLIP